MIQIEIQVERQGSAEFFYLGPVFQYLKDKETIAFVDVIEFEFSQPLAKYFPITTALGPVYFSKAHGFFLTYAQR